MNAQVPRPTSCSSPPIGSPQVWEPDVFSLSRKTSVWARRDPSLGWAWTRPLEASRCPPVQAISLLKSKVWSTKTPLLSRLFFSFLISPGIERGLPGQRGDVGGATLTWSCRTCSWSACWALAAIREASRNLVEHLCFRPSISSAQYRCLSSNSWQVSASLSSKLTCGICQHSPVRTAVLLMRRWLRNGGKPFFTCSSCSSVSRSSSLCSRCSISDSSVVMGERIPPEDSERRLTGSSAESRDTSSFALLPLKSDLLPQSMLLPFPLTHAGRQGRAPLVRLLARAAPPSLWLTGPVEALKLPLVLWVGKLDIELRPESDSVPERQKRLFSLLQLSLEPNLSTFQ